VTTRVALDAQLLLLLLVGLVERDYVQRHKRLNRYDANAFDLLVNNIGGARGLFVTPNALTEVSNLLDYGVDEPLRSKLWRSFAGFIKSSVVEEYRSSLLVVQEQEFLRLGLADCAWLGSIDSSTVLLTDDLQLYNAAKSRGITTYYFTHLRIEAGQLPA
jgi:predicted nucleic acid-binding protein